MRTVRTPFGWLAAVSRFPNPRELVEANVVFPGSRPRGRANSRRSCRPGPWAKR
ncbi:hypothetical protein FTUN_2304 [Frigoriglobus tundricola]|uniref:Uncharacterized protein n=1 Tax=Frigoriglobus tundricola TaxID=2774151 RepID=A0A6M5YNF8_9BACT|nr:hypothetical protein FTUN_2304 [Frigoriglobus tundricola]